MTGDRPHPQARALLDLMYRVGAPPFHTLGLAQARQAFRRLQEGGRPSAPAVALARDLVIPREGGGGELPARLYRPQSSRADERLALLVYFHGGGWTVGDVETHDVLCRELCNGAGCAVLSVEYRLAPEHPFPAAPEDAILAVRWAAAHAEGLGADGARLAVGGDSAGGNLAIVAALAARDAGGPALRFQLLFYPATDQSNERPSHVRLGRGYGLDHESILWFQRHYLRKSADATDWRASPLLAPTLAGLPPAWVVTAGFDPLLDDCSAYVERLRSERVEVTHRLHPGMIHGFVPLGRLFDDAREAVAEAAAALRSALQAPGPNRGGEP